MFAKLTFLQRSLIILLLVLAALCYALPWGFYTLGLRRVGRLPEAPKQLVSAERQQQLWTEAGFSGAPELTELSPGSYLLGAAGQDAPPPVTLFAWRISSAYLHQNHRYAGNVLEQQLSGGALTVWLTRNWSLAEILSRVAELEAVSPTPPKARQAAPEASLLTVP